MDENGILYFRSRTKEVIAVKGWGNFEVLFSNYTITR